MTTPVKLVEIVKDALPEIVRRYERYSGEAPASMPESPIRDGLAEAIYERSRCWCLTEIRIDRLAADEHFSVSEDEKRCKLDLAVYETHPDPNKAHDPDKASLRYLIEVKGPNTRWESFQQDCERLRRLLLKCNTKLGFLISVTGNMSPAKLPSVLGQTSSRTGVPREQFIQTAEIQPLRKDCADTRWLGIIVPVNSEQPTQ